MLQPGGLSHQGWLLRRTTIIERWALIVAGIMLAYPAPLFDFIGMALVIAVVALQRLRHPAVVAAPS